MNEIERNRKIEEQGKIMKAYLEGKAIQCLYKGEEDEYWKDVKHPEWNWGLFDYRIKPEESDEPKKPMTYRQLAELMAKGYGENLFVYRDGSPSVIETTFDYLSGENNPVSDRRMIRAWGSDEWIEPTVDIYEEYIAKWNRAFAYGNALVENKSSYNESLCDVNDYSDDEEIEPSIGERFLFKGKLYECIEGEDCDKCAINYISCYAFKCNDRKDGKSVVFVDVSKKENTATEDSSSTQGECIGVHKRTPQEIADFFGCYVAMDEDGSWHLFTEEPSLITDVKEIWMPKKSRIYIYLFINDAFLSKPNLIDWKTLYRPHKEPIVMEGN